MEGYQSLAILGRGAFGVAHLVRRRIDGDLLVLKEIDLSGMKPSLRRAAQTEAEVLRSLSHVNIVSFIETFLEQNSLCIVMEFADGGDLARAVATRRSEGNRRFAEGEALATFAQICAGLRHCHERHILHRDIKSSNIFLTQGGVVKLGDLGIAKVLEHTTAKAETNIGTPSYASPEVCNNEPYGIKADIWSTGVVLFEMLALEMPFQGSNLVVLVMRIIGEDPRPLPEDCSAAARAVVSRTLSKRPEERPTADELLALPVVRQGAESDPATSVPPSSHGGRAAPARSVPTMSIPDAVDEILRHMEQGGGDAEPSRREPTQPGPGQETVLSALLVELDRRAAGEPTSSSLGAGPPGAVGASSGLRAAGQRLVSARSASHPRTTRSSSPACLPAEPSGRSAAADPTCGLDTMARLLVEVGAPPESGRVPPPPPPPSADFRPVAPPAPRSRRGSKSSAGSGIWAPP